NTYIYFKIFILTINFRFFGLPIRVQLITLRIQIFFVPPYKTCSGIFTFRVG
ncbi:unnamed protein product, partial [Brassica rapa]